MARLVAFGDIHGQFNTLKALIEQITPTVQDTVVFTGDYIDRGVSSRDVIDFLVKFKRKFPKTVFLRGNHDQMFLDYLVQLKKLDDGELCDAPGLPSKKLREFSKYFDSISSPNDMELFTWNGGETTLECYTEFVGKYTAKVVVPKEHMDFLNATEFHRFIKMGDVTFLCTHANLPTYSKSVLPILEDPGFGMWYRMADDELGTHDEYDIHLFGHTPHNKVLITDTHICVDTGAGYKRDMSVVVYDEKTEEIVAYTEKFKY